MLANAMNGTSIHLGGYLISISVGLLRIINNAANQRIEFARKSRCAGPTDVSDVHYQLPLTTNM